MPVAALEGLRVLDLSSGIAGPYCARLLADYGADVVKVEAPNDGDWSRRIGPFPDGVVHTEKSALFLHLNTSKNGVTLDLEKTEGRELLKRLADSSDIIVESHLPGALAELGVGYDDLKLGRPDLVMASITPFGQTGPHKDFQYTELTVFAMGGGMHREGVPEREPLRYGAEAAQYFAGNVAAAAAMAASYRALLGGGGEWIDISIQECMAGHPHQAGRRAPFVYSGDVDARRKPHTAIAGLPAYAVGTFRCRDGHVSFLPLGPRMWPGIARMIDRPDLLEDARFESPESRLSNKDEFDVLLTRWLDTRTREEVFLAAQREGIPCSPVLETSEVIEYPQFKDRGHFVAIEHPEAGELTYSGLPFKMPAPRANEPAPAPLLGEHNELVYAGIGLDGAELVRLRERGVI